MRTAWYILAAGLLLSTAAAVHGNDDPPFVREVAPRVRLKDVCKIADRPLYQLVTSKRARTGDHTHTCAKGHIRDHDSRGGTGHVCQEWVLGSDGNFRPCGLVSTIKGYEPFVTVTDLVQVSGPAPAPQSFTPPSTTAAGCANGRCESSSFAPGRTGLFGRPRR